MDVPSGPPAVVPPDVAGVAGPTAGANGPVQSYWSQVPRQVVALLKKNFILAWRNRTATFLRILASFFFILRIPDCRMASSKSSCMTFAYTSAPGDEFVPSADYKDMPEFMTALDQMNLTTCKKDSKGNAITCSESVCSSTTCVQEACNVCGPCCASWRVHRIVRGIMKNNGTSYPIPSTNVIGFTDATKLDKYMFANPQLIQGAYIFNSLSDKKTTFAVQQNTSATRPIRGDWEKPYVTITIPMQVIAHKEIARQVIFPNDSRDMQMDLDLVEFAHPAFAVSTFEGIIAPLFILGCAMFPFVIQMGEVVTDKENKFRQALSAMGLHDLSYWLSWHIYQSTMAFIAAFFLYAFGCIFQFRLFLKNDFGVLFMTFWLFGQAMIGLGFLISSLLSKSASAVTVGFAGFLMGFLLFFVVVFGMPYGVLKDTYPFSYELNITTGNYTLKTSGDVALEPIFSILPPSLLVKAISDFGQLSAADKDLGLRFSDRYSYCTIETQCNPSYSVGKAWEAFIALYIIYSLLGLYLDNVVPDAMGVRKPLWYFLVPSYWGFGASHVADSVRVLEASTDEDVIAEEALVQQRQNHAMGPNSAIEVRGLVQRFSRGGKDFFAVKAPWYAVNKRQLFALLGPNGAGKSTTINMLTGFLPPTSGNALVFGHTVSSPNGMTHVRRLMGVCPQFDILWDNLSAKQHLELFGAIKGISPASLSAEADKRLEEVRLTESANQRAGAFSGGMKRRLSVAVALIGNPEVVYLDEPTTGMDPINRRHVWDVIEAAKQDRCVVLTTHSMEEADILGDRIGIMAKGRLRCLGNSVRLKTRFGAGYKVSVSVGDNVVADDPKCVAVKELLDKELQATLSEQSKAYMHFNLPASTTSDDDKMARFFKTIEEKKDALNIQDVQLSMSTLEDVFLRIAKDCEVDEAKRTNKTVNVELRTGEKVSVLMGSEEVLTSPGGTTFTVVWGTDDNGTLIVVDTKEVQMQSITHLCQAPADAVPGQLITVQVQGTTYQVPVPQGTAPGGQFNVAIQVPVDQPTAGIRSVAESEAAPEVALSAAEIKTRVENLRTPFSGQSNALFRKNLSFQKQRKCNNCCLMCVPVVFLIILLLLQLLIEILVINKPSVRCPYCGPADDFAKKQCQNQNCTDFFFPKDNRDDFISLFKVDVIKECNAVAATCVGNGNISCFKPEWAVGGQIAWCPFTTLAVQPVSSYAGKVFPSKTPVLYTSTPGASPAFADSVAKHMFVDKDSGVDTKLRAAARTTANLMWVLLSAIPRLGCSNPTTLDSIMTLPQEQALCKLVQEGAGPEEPCCMDMTDVTVMPMSSKFRSGVNYWSDHPLHNDTMYDESLAACQLVNTSSGWITNTTAEKLKECNTVLYGQWMGQGAKFGTGFGKVQVMGLIKGLQQPPLFENALTDFIKDKVKFRCVRPAYSGVVKDKLEGKCNKIEESLAIIAKYTGMAKEVFPNPEPNKNIPECTANGDCEFSGIKDGPLGENFAISGGRWAQVCDFYTDSFMQDIKERSSDIFALTEYMSKMPCTCSWLYAAKQIVAATALPSGNAAPYIMGLPDTYNCPPSGCTPFMNKYHPLSIQGLNWMTPIFAGRDRFFETVLSVGRGTWWNRARVYKSKTNMLDARAKFLAEKTCDDDKNCWFKYGTNSGNMSFISANCSALADASCYIKRMGNLSGLQLDCVDAKPERLESQAAINERLYKGHYDLFDPLGNAQALEEFMGAYDLRDSDTKKFNVGIAFNETTVMTSGMGAQGPPPRQLRLEGLITVIFDAFINGKMGGAALEYGATLMGLKEMPKFGGSLYFDLGSALGPFFFSMAMNLLFPAIVVAIVYEKEMKLRVMMRMMGLSSSAYWIINYLFWMCIYIIFCVLFILLASIARLPSGYTLAMITKQSYGIHVIFFFLFVNNTISFAFLWATLIRFARTASVAATLWVLAMALIAYLAWETGNFFNAPNVSTPAKNIITVFPIWSFYRGLSEYKEYASLAVLLNSQGMTWDEVRNDPRCGFNAVLVALFVEWPIFLVLALYLDQVIDSGHGVPKHPLFFLGFQHSADAGAEIDMEAVGGGATLEDVKREADRVHELAAQGADKLDAVTIQAIGKVFPAYMGNKPKVAVKTLTMGVHHGECFGMLGPNGAGKTTTINMLVGFTQPTHGTAIIEGFDITKDMDRIYTLMGVCPQHDILWETLTARQHMLFYGRLKNLRGEELKKAVVDGLKQVNLLNVIDEKAGTYSGGMKRRLSVAVSMIGSPLCCYLDEPSSGLDPASRRTLWACIKQAKKNRAIFLTTHSMEEAEGLCDRLGIFVDGALRCIGNPKELTSRFGGFYILTITSGHGDESKVSEVVHSMAKNVRITYSLSGTQKFEIPIDEISLAQVFEKMRTAKETLDIKDWGIANTTLEEAFIKICRGAIGT